MQKAMVTFIDSKVRKTDCINPEFKSSLIFKVLLEVESNRSADCRFVEGNNVCFNFDGLTYDIYFDAWISNNFDEIEIGNVQCYVADFVNDIDDIYANEQGEVIDFLDGLILTK